MKKTVLREYARLIVRCGVNVQKGQEVIVYADLDQPEFVRMVVEEAYKAKAKKVTVEWSYQPLTKVHTRYRSVTTMGTVEEWQKAKYQHEVDVVPCRIHLMSEDPDGLKGINMEKVTKARRMSYPIIKPYQDQLENRQQWCIAAVPGAAWAKKVFPGERTGTAMEKLWEAILFTSRVTDDPEKAWADHDKDLQARCDYLNSLGIRSLHYTADNGTDFTVGLIPEGRFCGGGETARTGIFFNPNIPTEECFVSPRRGQAEGIVQAPELSGPADRGLLHPLCRRQGRGGPRREGRGPAQGHDLHGRGCCLPGRVRPGAPGQSHCRERPAVLQHPVRRECRTWPWAWASRIPLRTSRIRHWRSAAAWASTIP